MSSACHESGVVIAKMANYQSIGCAAASCLAGKRVLVVEDNWVVAEALHLLLEETGLVVSGPSATIADAQRLVSEQVPQLAIVDLRLRGELTFGLIDSLYDRGVSVVVVSGLVSTPPAKAAAVVQKPFSGAELIDTLCEVELRRPGIQA
jgi:DNA-binding response OmpR family regulator